jgi:hypothetical protein
MSGLDTSARATTPSTQPETSKRSGKQPTFSATVVAILCIAASPALALVSPAERTRIIVQPRWSERCRAPIQPELPSMALLPASLRQPRILLDSSPAFHSATPRWIGPKRKRYSASLRITIQHGMFAHLKGHSQGRFQAPDQRIFFGGLY